MTCDRARRAVAALPVLDLPDEVALHLDGCAGCRAAFDARFAPAPFAVPAARPVPWGAVGAGIGAVAVAAGVAAAVLGVGAPALERPVAAPAAVGVTWTPTPAPAAAQGPAPTAAPGVPVGATWLVGQAGDVGDPVVYVFWEAWCPHCGEGLEAAEALARDVPDVDVIGVTGLSKGVSADEARDFALDHGVDFPIVVDTTLKERFGVRSWPRAVVVRGGEVVWEGHPGEIEREVLLGTSGKPE